MYFPAVTINMHGYSLQIDVVGKQVFANGRAY